MQLRKLKSKTTPSFFADEVCASNKLYSGLETVVLRGESKTAASKQDFEE